MPAFAARDFKVLCCSLRPFRRIAHRHLLKVQYRDAGAYQRTDGLVEGDQHRWRAIARAPAIMLEQHSPDAAGAQPLALHRQKRELVQRVETAQIASEFEAIDDLRRRSQTDMLGTEIAMPLYDPASPRGVAITGREAADKGFDVAHDAAGGILQRGTAAGIKGTAARAAFSAEAVEIGNRLDRHAPGRREELGEAVGKRMNIGVVPVPSGEAAVQHPLGGEPDHLDQPVDDEALAANRQGWPLSRVSGTTPI